MGKKNLKSTLFWFFVLVGVLPLMIVILVNGYQRIDRMEEDAKDDLWLKVTLVDNHVTDMVENNFRVLHVMASNSLIQQYAISPTKEQAPAVEKAMMDANWVFQDSNLMALTAADGHQLFRTDGEPLVNVSKREHYRQAMQGKDFVSNRIKSMSTGEEIIVMAVPVKDSNYQVVGMLQRNFATGAYQSFVMSMAESKIAVVLLDREEKMLACSHSELLEEFEADNPVPHQLLSQTLAGIFGVTRMDVDGQDCLVGYKKNSVTGWPIIMIYPYRYILDAVNAQIFRLAMLGIFCLMLVSLMAYRFSGQAAKPVLEVIHRAKQQSMREAAQEAEPIVATNSDVEEIAEVFQAIRSERDAFRQETERDTLTGLYTKNAMEAICRKKLKEYSATGQKYDSIAFYLINLDYFKKLNETEGRLYGDRVLLEFAERLKKCFRPLDCVGRLEKDEFLAVADQVTDVAEVMRKAKHINRIAKSLVVDDRVAEISASIGIAFFPQHGASYETVLRAARNALSKVKAEGRDDVYGLAN